MIDRNRIYGIWVSGDRPPADDLNRVKMDIFEQMAERCAAANIVCTRDEPMAAHTTLRIGGPAKLYTQPCSVEEIQFLTANCKALGIAYHVVGNGSNLLVRDEGIEGVVIALRKNFNHIGNTAPHCVVAQAGALLSKVCTHCRDGGLGGLEFAYGIPATVGGAVYMNAGAYGGEMKDVVERVTVLTKLGDLKTYLGEEAAFEYRHSRFMASGEIVLEVAFALQPKAIADIGARMEELMGRRRDRQPLEYPSSGSTFKRPEGDFAARLIDVCGLKGRTVGDAQVSEKHSGFLINRGQATAEDFLALIAEVQQVVESETGCKLECEVQMI